MKKIFKAVKTVSGYDLAKGAYDTLSGAATAKAQKQYKNALDQQSQIAQQNADAAANMAANLNGENVADVQAGGTADVIGTGIKKKRQGGLSSALGVS